MDCYFPLVDSGWMYGGVGDPGFEELEEVETEEQGFSTGQWQLVSGSFHTRDLSVSVARSQTSFQP